jgi:DNA-binding CsgD family transcriptional regulator
VARATPVPAVRKEPHALEHGRQAIERRAWADAFRLLSLADQSVPLGADDLEQLALAAGLSGRDDDFLKAFERAHQAHVDAGECLRAARAAFWLGFRLHSLGEKARATGWLARAQRLVEREARDCVEAGYLLVPLAYRQLAAGDPESAHATAARAAEIGDRFAEADLSALARNLQGRALVWLGQVEAGLALLDEAMLAATGGELSPPVTGLIYCNVIDSCQNVYALDRAREWTTAHAAWCDAQPQLIAFSGICLVHRAEIMQLNGAWQDAIAEARRASTRDVRTAEQQAVAAAALYQEGEVHRLKGEFAAAEEAYRGASQLGCEPQPGLSLLRLAQGRRDAAAAAIRRVTGAPGDRLRRIKLLPAFVEIMLAVDDIAAAREACGELDEIAEDFGTEVLGAIAAHARGAVDLAAGDAQAAVGPLRHAFAVWQQVEAPYIAARIRVLVGLTCRALGDEDGAALELDAASAAFEALGAAPDLARIAMLAKAAHTERAGGLTARELQVLRLVAAGKTNKAIAGELQLSEKTVDRHVSNIFVKLDVPSRAAATAYAYEHKLI